MKTSWKETKQIGNQVWMAENLNYNVSGSVCYENKDSNCEKYGRLYDWATAMALPANCNESECASQISAKHRGICPSGWHIPSDADCNALMKFVNPSCSDNENCPSAGTKLKTKSGWDDGLEGKSGNGSSGGSFSGVGYYSSWLSSSEENSDYAYRRGIINFEENVHYNYGLGKSYLQSVRCVKD